MPLIAAVGRRLAGGGAGLASALLLSCSSYLLFYSQMVKMYALLLLLALLSSYLLLRALERTSAGRWAAYVAVTAATMQVHVFGALVIPWHAAFALIRVLGPGRHTGSSDPGHGPPEDHRRRFLLPLAAFSLLVLPYLPLALGRLAALQAPETLSRQFTGPQEPLGMFVTLAREYGTRFDQLPGEPLTWAFVCLTAAGLAALAFPRFRSLSNPPAPYGFVFLSLGLVLPIGLTYALVAAGAPLFSSRYQLVTLPAFLLAWGAAVALAWGKARVLGTVLLLGFLVLNGARWWQTAVQGQRFREDWRSAVAYLESRQRPGDPVLVLHDASFRAVDYYRTQPMALVSLERGPELPPDLGRAPSFPPGTRGWLLTAFFEVREAPQVERWLDQRSQLTSKAWVPGIVVSEYRAP